MAEDNNGLDSFLSGESGTTTPNNNTTEEINLEDEFAKLLNDFVNQGNTTSQPKETIAPTNPSPQIQTAGLDSMLTPTNNSDINNNISNSFTTPSQPQTSGGLDGFITGTAAPTVLPQNNLASNNPPTAGGLDSMISSPSNASASGGLDSMVTNNVPASTNIGGTSGLDSMVTPPAEQEATTKESSGLKEEERELAQKIKNFQDSMGVISMKKNLKTPTTDYMPEMLIPNYKPSIGKKIAEYLLASWDIINKYAPEDMKRLAPDADDEGYLSFAETLNDTDLQLAIISYVEILIDIEICEVSYEQKKEIMIKNRIKKELYEEYMALQERKKLFIAKLKEKNFPIDVERLMNNYFRAAQKDPDSSFEALTKNPAMFAPIQMEKIKPKFFGLIKVTPEDGIKANQKIGAFIKKLKV